MLIFLRSNAQADAVITTANPTILLADYAATYPRLGNGVRVVVPWYSIDADPVAFGRRLLTVAATDPVCLALIDRATTVWGLDFSVNAGAFVTEEVQNKYLKLLKVWLSPLSGNLGSRNAHRSDVDEQYARLWSLHGLNQGTLRNLVLLPFFSELNVAGRRDRIQIYRNVTEAARALVGEVTTWPSRTIEKISVLSLLRSPGLGALQRRMLSIVATGLANGDIAANYTMWEYLPYYLRGVPLEPTDTGTAQPRVLGALHDCLNDALDTRAVADQGLIGAFQALAGGAEYRRWRMLPPVARYQVLISDLARILPGGKQHSPHIRVEFDPITLGGLPGNIAGYDGWPVAMRVHAGATPHDPGQAFPFSTGWTRNEYCSNVVSSRLMLAPLYAGTSGHNQGRIRAWLSFVPTLPGLANIPLGLVISAGYSVLWRLYYDKRVSGFHTLFETFQGSHADDTVRDLSAIPQFAGDDVWNAALNRSRSGRTQVRSFWRDCLALYMRQGRNLGRELKVQAAQARQLVLQACPGAVIPRWNTTGDVDRTGTEVDVWAGDRNEEVLREYEVWRRLTEGEAVPRLVGGSSMNAVVLHQSQAPILQPTQRLTLQADIAAAIGARNYLGDSQMKKLFHKWLVTNASDKTTDEEEKRKRDDEVQRIRSMFDELAQGNSGPTLAIASPHQSLPPITDEEHV
ncbi:hypothetical protein ACN469_19020 [Corallococcus terminator]